MCTYIYTVAPTALVHSSILVTEVYLLIQFNKILINRLIDKILFYIAIVYVCIK